MTLFALTVARNEAERYLPFMIHSVVDAVDEHFVFDDRSDDTTADICQSLGCTVKIRGIDDPSFAMNEGAFRQAAWDSFEAAMRPQPGDWVLSIDADELLAARHPTQMRDVARDAAAIGLLGVRLPIPEVWGLRSVAFSADDELGDRTEVWTKITPQVRADGEWGRQRQCRLFAYQPAGRFARRVQGVEHILAMACGHTPNYVQALHADLDSQDGLALLHLGYLKAGDRKAKYERYSRLGGHSPWHLRSILQPPVLTDWAGTEPVGGWR